MTVFALFRRESYVGSFFQSVHRTSQGAWTAADVLIQEQIVEDRDTIAYWQEMDPSYDLSDLKSAIEDPEYLHCKPESNEDGFFVKEINLED